MTRGAELSTDLHLVVNWISWWGRMLDKPSTPKPVMRVPLTAGSSTTNSDRTLTAFWGRMMTMTLNHVSHLHFWGCLMKLQLQGGWCLNRAIKSEERVLSDLVRLVECRSGNGWSKTSVWEEFSEAFRLPQSDSGNSGVEHSALFTVYSVGGVLLTFTGDIVGKWKDHFKDFLAHLL